MTVCVTFLPMIAQLAPGIRMHEIRRQLGEGPQDERVLEHVRARQAQRRLVDNAVAIQQQIDIERSRRESLTAPLPAGHVVNLFNLLLDLEWRLIRLECRDEIQEVVAFEPDCGILVGARQLDRTESFPELFDREPQIFLGVDVAII